MASPGGKEIGKVSIRVIPDTSRFRRELVRELKKIEKSLKVEIPVKVDTKKAITQLKALDTVSKKLDGRKIRMNASVDSKGLGDITKSVEKLSKASGPAADGFGRMGHGMMIFVAVLVLAAPLIGLIATLIAGLPSLLFVAGAGFAAIALGMDGIKKAASVLGPQVDSLKASLSATFEKGLTPIFEQLRGIFPVLEAGLNDVAQGLVNMAKPIVDVLLLPENLERLRAILAQVGAFFEGLGPVIAVFVNSLLILGDVGSAAFGPLIDVLLQAALQFNEIVARLADSGILTAALGGLAEVFGSILTVFNQLFEVGVKFMPLLAGPMVSLFQGLGNAVVSLMPALTALSNLLFSFLGEALNALVPIFEALTPSFLLLAELIGVVLSGAIKVLQPLLLAAAEIIDAVLIVALKALEPILEPLINFLVKLAEIIANNVMAAFEALAPLLDVIAVFVTDLLLAFEPLLPPLLELADVILAALVDLFERLTPVVVDLANKVFPDLIDIVVQLMPGIITAVEALAEFIVVIIDAAAWILENLVPAITNLWEVVENLIPQIVDFFKAAFDVIEGSMELFTSLIKGDWQGMADALKKVGGALWDAVVAIFKGGVKLILDIIIGIPISIAGIFGEGGKKIFESGKALIQSFINGLKSMLQSAKNTASNIVSAIRDFFPFSPAKVGPFSGSGYTTYSGIALMEDWAAGIAEGKGAAMAAVEDVTGATAGALAMSAEVSSDGFDSVGARIENAMSGWTVQVDANGLSRMVRKVDLRNARR